MINAWHYFQFRNFNYLRNALANADVDETRDWRDGPMGPTATVRDTEAADEDEADEVLLLRPNVNAKLSVLEVSSSIESRVVATSILSSSDNLVANFHLWRVNDAASTLVRSRPL